MKHPLFVLLLGFVPALQAQTDIHKTYAYSPSFDAGVKILPSADGYVIFGNQRQSTTDTRRDAFLVRVNRAGEQIAHTVYGSPTATEGSAEGMGIAATPDGWILATNKTESIIGSVSQAWLLRINTAGAVIWSQTASFSGLNNIVLSDVAPVPGGGFLACGYGVIGSGRQMIALKVSDNGVVEWSRKYGPGAGIGLYVSPGGSNGVIAGGNKIWKIRTLNGDVAWEKTLTPPLYGAATGTVSIDLNDVTPTIDGEFAVAGMISNDDLLEFNSAFYVATWTEAGTQRWERLYHSATLTNFSLTEATSVQYLPNAQELLLGGVFDGQLLISRLNLKGVEKDSRTIMPTGELFNPAVIKAGPYYAATGGVLIGGANIDTYFFRSAGNSLDMSAGSGNTNNTTPPATLAHDGLRVYPNPAVHQVTIELDTETGGVSTLRLTDAAGRMVRLLRPELVAGYNRLEVNLEGLAPGLYWLNSGQANVPAQILLKRE